MRCHQLASKIDSLPITLKREVEKYIDSLLEKAKINNDLIKKKPVFGCAKGHFKMSEDFDEPMEDFKDYM